MNDAPKEIIVPNLRRGAHDFDEIQRLAKVSKPDYKAIYKLMPTIDEPLRAYLPLREDKAFTIATPHVRH